MDVESGLTEEKAGKLVVFSDIEYRIPPSFNERLRSKCRQGCGGVHSDSSAGRLILRGLCGTLRPARLTFILGPSGAGKTSLLQILAGRRSDGVRGVITGGSQGAVLVAQQATLLPALTAREVLLFASALKLPRVKRHQREAVVERVAQQLGIESTFDTRTPQMSGGERKRLAIACELLTDPPVLLLDEPTSGLDSVSSVSVIRALAAVARSGRTVACIVHQPASRLYTAADDLLLLSGGRSLYAGPRTDVPAALRRAGLECPNFYNPADFLLEVAMGEHGGDLNLMEKQARSYAYGLQNSESVQINGKVSKAGILAVEECDNLIKEVRCLPPVLNQRNDERPPKIVLKNDRRQCPSPLYAASLGRQLRVLLWRCGLCGARDAHLMQLRLAAHALVALLLGALYHGAGTEAARVTTNTSCLFFFLLFLFFANAMPTIHTFPAEADLVIQEHLNRWYSLVAYCLSKLLADLPVQILCATTFTIPAWYLTGQPADPWRLFYMWLICLLLTILAQTSGLAIGAACDVKAGLFIVPAANIPMLMFSGFFIPYHEMPSYLQPFAKISYFRYAFDASLQCAYGFDREKLPCHEDFCMFRNPEKFLGTLGVPNSYWGDVTALSIWILTFQISLMLILIWRVRGACK